MSSFYGRTKTTVEGISIYTEAFDSYGNAITETTVSGDGTIYRSFGYSDNGNDIVRETDPRGNDTLYTVDPETSRVTTVTDRCGNKTSYEYDSMGRTTKVTSKNKHGVEMSKVSYNYDTFDNMTEIVRGDGMKYVLEYDSFHNLESIGINGKKEKLIKYTYRDKNGRLKQITYANGDYMRLSYDRFGNMISEKWYDENELLTYEYAYAYDEEGNVVKTVDRAGKKEYNYAYDEGKLVRSVEYNVTFNSNGNVISRSKVVNIVYIYDGAGELLKKRVFFADGTESTISPAINADDNVDSSTFYSNVSGTADFTAVSETDGLGRKTKDYLVTTSGRMERSFTYHEGKVTSEHTKYSKVKGTATTQFVDKITYSDGRTTEYEYDAEERIIRVVDSIDGTTEYTYDALGQLLTETKNDVVIAAMTYDNYGNIKTKNGKSYGYTNAAWDDLLTSYDGQRITYDAQGNPTTYLGHTLAWEKGRQLKSFDRTKYTYNANGIRTSKTVNGVKHTYILDGTKVLKETWGTNTLIPLYDNEDSICGISYNGSTYYFVKNLQGDIIAIANASNTVVARYSYDAWGKCKVIDADGTENTSATFIGNINPFRYRGYYYDVETGLYYVSSRYYDAEIGRWLNSDDPIFLSVVETILSCNLFAYCENNAVNDCDPTGMLSVSKIVRFIKTIGSKAWGIITSIWKAFKKPGKINLKPFEIVIDVLVGVFVPSLSSALKLLTYKTVNKKLVQIAFKNAGKSFINLIAKLGVNIGLNTLLTTTVNNLIFKHMSRFLTVGGIICLVFDAIDGKIDYWFNYGKIFA